MVIEVYEENRYEVSCPYQSALSFATHKRFKVKFDKEICSRCPLSANCPAGKIKNRTFYFDQAYVNRQKRNNNIKNILKERRKLRANIESTMYEFERGFNMHGKLKTRGLIKARIFAFAMAFGINDGRIYRAELEEKLKKSGY